MEDITMNKLQQNQLNFLNDTVNFFKKNPRCQNKHKECVYYHKKYAGCAIGRHIEDKELCKRLDKLTNTSIAGMSYKSYAELPEALKSLGRAFLSEIQELHDDDSYWDKPDDEVETLEKLNSSGTEQVQRIKAKIKMKIYELN